MAEPNVDQPVGEDPPDSSNDASIDWSGLTNEIEQTGGDEDPPVAVDPQPAPETPPVETPPPAEPPEPETPPAAETPPPVEPEVPPTTEGKVEIPQVEPPAPVEPPPETPPEAAPAAAPTGPTPEELAVQQKQMDDYLAQTAQQYQLSEEAQRTFLTDPNSVIPQLAAQLQVNILQQAVATVTQVMRDALPQYLETYFNSRETTSKAEGDFYERWPELKEHETRVQEIGAVYRQMNPSVTPERFINDVGMQVWMAQGLPTATLAARLAPSESTPPTEEVIPPAAPPGYSPAPPTTPTPPVKPSTNIFTQLTEEFAADEDS